MVLNVPLSCIETCEQRDLFYLHISCKDARMYRLQLETNSMCEVSNDSFFDILIGVGK